MTLFGGITGNNFGSIAGGLAQVGSLGLGLATYADSKANSYKAMEQQYLFNLALMREQQAYQTKMSNTAHQREMADLAAAGLNPLLTATGGNGASTPSSGLNSVNAPDYSTSAQNGIAAAGKALELARYREEIKNLKANTQNQRQTAVNQSSQAILNDTKNRIELINELNLPKQWKTQLQLMNADVLMRTTQTSALQSERILNLTKINTEKETAKFMKERARGYSESWSENRSAGKKLFGMGGDTATSTSYSSTK